MDHYSCDVAIVGAGPAGCSAGIMLARSGAKVLLVDKAEFPREKPCGGLLTEKTCSFIAETLGLKGLEEVILQKSDRFDIYDGKQFVNSATTGRYTYYVSRGSFDNFLLESAKQAGCIVLTGTAVSNIESKTLHTGKACCTFKYLIGADGINSIVRRHLRLPLPKNNIALGLQVDVPLGSMPSAVKWDFPRIYFGYVRYGWGWAFPKGNHVSLGLAGLFPKGSKIKDAFSLFLAELSCEEAARGSTVRGAQIPYGSFLAFPAKNNVLLVGDAAGFADPVTGEGIYNAVLSGYIAADILGSGAHANKAKAYRNQCRARIIRSLRQAKLARWFLFEEPFHSLIMRKLHGNPKHMRLFMSVLAGEADYADYFCETVKGTLRPGRAVS